MVCGHCPPYVSKNDFKSNLKLLPQYSASLLAAPSDDLQPPIATIDSSIGHLTTSKIGIGEVSISQISSSQIDTNQIGIAQIGTSEVGIFKFSLSDLGTAQVSSGQIGMSKISVFSNSSISQISSSEIGRPEISFMQIGSAEIGTSQIGSHKVSSVEVGPIQFGSAQIRPLDVEVFQIDAPNSQVGSTQVHLHHPAFNPGQISPDENSSTQIDSSEPIFSVIVNNFDFPEVSLPSSISDQQFFQGHLEHNTTSNLLTNIYSTAQSIWHSNTAIDLNFAITNLPTGQLAEATITGYDNLGRPNTATITIDDDANGVGWFVDSTPGDSSEFRAGVGELGSGGVGEYFQADSAAYGKYDLLTAILHEMGHAFGIINGYSEFNKYVKGRQFITDTFSSQLTPDGSHLDTTLHPYDLMNTSLKPGVRKLPSAMDWAMIDALNSGVEGRVSGVGTVNPAHLTAGALLAINNGDFATNTGWNTLGATNIINGTATLTEQSQKLSELTQAFIIPTGAKTLQFTIVDNHLVKDGGTGGLGDWGNKAPNDAFEVALLDSNTFNPLAGTIGLTHSDSLLNIQANGTIHKSDKVTITALGNNSSIVTIDLTQVTPTTQATLYFNLLGFGARTSTVTIDDVKLFTDTQPIPVTNNDTLITTQNAPLTLDPTQLTTNDTNVSQIQIINQPTHGTLTQTPDGKLTYQPISTYVGNDSFTYLGFGSDGQISNLATVNITVNNLAPTIETLSIPNQINEGQTIQLKATAKDGGSSDNLTYTWDLGDNSQPVIGQNVTHQFVDNGTYNVTLTVTDKDGGITQQSTQLTVDNLAPTATITTPNTILNQGESLNLSRGVGFRGSTQPTVSCVYQSG
jgi:PKD domain/Bacterial Ig domain